MMNSNQFNKEERSGCLSLASYLILFFLLGLWAILLVVVGGMEIVFTPSQIEKDKNFIARELQPRIDYVNEFSKNHGELPTQNEYIDFLLTWDPGERAAGNEDILRRLGSDDYFPAADKNRVPSEVSDNIDMQQFPDDGWVIAVWRGEWWEFYTSWDNHYYTNNYTWNSTIWMLVEGSLIGFGPIVIFVVILYRGQKRNLKLMRPKTGSSV